MYIHTHTVIAAAEVYKDIFLTDSRLIMNMEMHWIRNILFVLDSLLQNKLNAYFRLLVTLSHMLRAETMFWFTVEWWLGIFIFEHRNVFLSVCKIVAGTCTRTPPTFWFLHHGSVDQQEALLIPDFWTKFPPLNTERWY